MARRRCTIKIVYYTVVNDLVILLRNMELTENVDDIISILLSACVIFS
jgi:hypothetical protein